MEEQQGLKAKFKDFSKECLRVLKITKKPTMKEYKVIVTITGIGILLIGFIGFVITIIKQLFF
jgi:protein transport protein SEC61 subunit gamma and related proteins